VGNSSVVIEAAALDDILASQAAAASGLDPIDWDAIGGASRCPVSPVAIRRTSMRSFFDPTTFSGAVNPDGSDPWWAGWTFDGSL
jgi:hypothetical protein